MAELAALIVGVRRMRLHCLVGGTGGEPVVLLHGGGIDSAALTYRHTLPALAAHARVYAPDWPGYGRSSPPDRTPDLAFHRDVLEALLDTLGLARASLVGISLGGGAALGSPCGGRSACGGWCWWRATALARRCPGACSAPC